VKWSDNHQSDAAYADPNTIVDIVERIVAALFGAAFLVGYLIWNLIWRWRSAGRAADRTAATHSRARVTFEALKQDGRLVPLHEYLASRYRTTFEAPSDGATYRICYIAMMDDLGDRVFVPNGARARYLAAYLQRADAPTRLQTTLDLRTGAISEMAANALVWRTVPPMD
jgi:hypothetical protein